MEQGQSHHHGLLCDLPCLALGQVWPTRHQSCINEKIKDSFTVICSYHDAKFTLKALASNVGKLAQLLLHSVPIAVTHFSGKGPCQNRDFMFLSAGPPINRSPSAAGHLPTPGTWDPEFSAQESHGQVSQAGHGQPVRIVLSIEGAAPRVCSAKPRVGGLNQR